MFLTMTYTNFKLNKFGNFNNNLALHIIFVDIRGKFQTHIDLHIHLNNTITDI